MNHEPENCSNRYTALHLAAENGSLTACIFIINWSLYKGGKDRYRRTPIEDKNPTDTAGWTPLHCAAQNGYEEIYNLIASQVVDKNPRASDGTTPEFLMRRLFLEEFKSISPRVECREQARWNGFEEIKLNNGRNTVWWARTANSKTHFY